MARRTVSVVWISWFKCAIQGVIYTQWHIVIKQTLVNKAATYQPQSGTVRYGMAETSISAFLFRV